MTHEPVVRGKCNEAELTHRAGVQEVKLDVGIQVVWLDS